MIAIQHERSQFWLRLKLLLAWRIKIRRVPPATVSVPPKRRSHRTTAFFEMP